MSVNVTVTKTDRYRCVSTQEEIDHQISAETFVHISGAASKPSVTILEETKDQALLQCEVSGAFPKPLLQWTDSSGNIIHTAEPQVSERGGSYDVTLQTTVTKTDNYSCVASQEEIKSKPAHIYVSLSGEESERSSDSGSPIGWIVLSAVLSIMLVVGGVVVYIKLNHLNKKIEKLEKTEERNTPPADSAAYPMISDPTVP